MKAAGIHISPNERQMLVDKFKEQQVKNLVTTEGPVRKFADGLLKAERLKKEIDALPLGDPRRLALEQKLKFVE